MSSLKNKTAFLFFFCFAFVSLLSADEAVGDPDAARFKHEINRFMAWDKKNSFPDRAILFLGSSSIRMWPSAEYFPELKVINRGFGGAHISDVNYYYKKIVLKYSPRLIVFYAGDNDIAAGKSISQVLEDFRKFINRVGQDLKGAKILYLPVKPSPSRWQFWQKMNTFNMRIKKLCGQRENLIYVDTASPMLGNDQRPRKKLFISDGLHLNKKGYDLWTSILKSYIFDLLKIRKRGAVLKN